MSVVSFPSTHLKMGQPQPLFHLFSVFSNKLYNFYNKWMWKHVHPVYGAGIRTHDLSNKSRHPKPLDQGSRPCPSTHLYFTRYAPNDEYLQSSSYATIELKHFNFFNLCSKLFIFSFINPGFKYHLPASSSCSWNILIQLK